MLDTTHTTDHVYIKNNTNQEKKGSKSQRETDCSFNLHNYILYLELVEMALNDTGVSVLYFL